MATIRLSRGEIALVDDDDLPLTLGRSWYAVNGASGNVYVQARHGSGHIFLHTLITGIKYVDHKNNNGLDNRRSNLRPANHSKNGMNRAKIKNTSSQYKGVGWHKATGCWRAYIKINGKVKSLGYYKDEVKAAKAYDEAATKLFGEFALLNFGSD